ncbi:MAG: hypothetical protein GQ535_16365 [Rhodobacteraceae bacterium]|nr:hypothetical protein [Paracoccaceae bacterium]
MKILVSALLLLSFLSACEDTMNHGMTHDDGMAMEGEMAMDSMSDG